MIYNGLALMLCAGAGLYGVLHQLRHMALAWFHERLWADPLSPPRSRAEGRHLTRQCSECSLIAELATAHATAL